ncbi:MAG: hypothetical protein V4805_08325 [Pseudomonadota bacterium]
MQLPISEDERFEFFSTLQSQLKPKDFWVTDFLATRLMDVEWTFCGGEAENEATVRCCAQYCRDLLRVIHPDIGDFEEALRATPISPSAKTEISNLLLLDASSNPGQITTQQACCAVSGFLHLWFRRNVD